MTEEHSHLSDHCIVDHFSAAGDGLTLRERMLAPMFAIDRLMHFTGVRGRLWAMLGVRRSPKNPNVCNI